VCANRIDLLLSLQWQYAFHAHSFTQDNTFSNTHNCVLTCKKDQAKMEAAGRVEAQRAENGGRRPIIWQRSSGQEALVL